MSEIIVFKYLGGKKTSAHILKKIYSLEVSMFYFKLTQAKTVYKCNMFKVNTSSAGMIQVLSTSTTTFYIRMHKVIEAIQ